MPNNTFLHLRRPSTYERVIHGIAFGDSSGLAWEGLSSKMIPQDDRSVVDFFLGSE